MSQRKSRSQRQAKHGGAQPAGGSRERKSRPLRRGGDPMRVFLRRVWREDVAPLLRDRRAGQRRKAARTSGTIAAAGGLVLDGLLRLKGKPFTRAMTVMGASLGAMLPDALDFEWLRKNTDARARRKVADQFRARVRRLPERDALALFGLSPKATREDLRSAWHAASLRWHPDKAPDETQRVEHQMRFIAYKSAYEILTSAYEEGRLPQEKRTQYINLTRQSLKRQDGSFSAWFLLREPSELGSITPMPRMSDEIDPAIRETFGQALELLAVQGFRTRASHFDRRNFGNFIIDVTGRRPNFRIIRDRSEHRIEAAPDLNPPRQVFSDPIELVAAILLWANELADPR